MPFNVKNVCIEMCCDKYNSSEYALLQEENHFTHADRYLHFTINSDLPRIDIEIEKEKLHTGEYEGYES